MSFLRRDKSKSNLKASFGLTAAGQYLSGEEHSNNSSLHSILNPRHTKVSRKSSSANISPTMSSSSSLTSNHQDSAFYDDYHIQNELEPVRKHSASEIPRKSSHFEITKKSVSNDPKKPQGESSKPTSNLSEGLRKVPSEIQRRSTNPEVYRKLPPRSKDVYRMASVGTEVKGTNDGDNYSPRSSMISLDQMDTPAESTGSDSNTSNLKENYRGFHANKRPKAIINVPPLTQPIKPRFKKKSGSLLGKLIYSSRKDSDSSANSEDIEALAEKKSRSGSVGSGPHTSQLHHSHQRKSTSSGSSSSSKHKFRLPSISMEHYHTPQSHPSSPKTRRSVPEYNAHEASKKPVPGAFDLDINLDEMLGIVKTTEADVNANPVSTEASLANDEISPNPILTQPEIIRAKLPLVKSFSSAGFTTPTEVPSNANPTPAPPAFGTGSAGWKAPDSWDVKIDQIIQRSTDSGATLYGSDSEEKDDNEDNLNEFEVHSSSSSAASIILTSSVEGTHHQPHKKHLARVKRREEIRDGRISRNVPILYGTNKHAPHETTKGPNHIVRVFKEDNTFTTILCPFETTTAELLVIVQRKFFLESTSNYQISIIIGNCVKVLEPFEKPIKIQTGLLTLSGYNESDNLKMIGREDLSFVCKFVVENINLRNLTHDEEAMLSKDYVDVNISNLKLKNIPIIFHQHTYEIEKLNVSDNPAIYIPLDFIQSCNNLTSINFSRNGCSKFPMNFLEAKKLTHLMMEKNFLDELPPKISHLKNLTYLKLNSNQLTSLPKSFGKLNNLIYLNLSSNYFSEYPEPISNLENLTDLDLSYNDLSELPESISRLTKLSKLNLCTNKLSKSLPSFISKMFSLKRLDIRYNSISNVDVLGSLPNLEVAYASKNNISAFNDRMDSLRLLHFDRNPITNLHFDNLLQLLTILDLSKAMITSIPAQFLSRIPNIEKLVLDKNHLVELPKELGNLSKLSFLSMYGNNLLSLPPTIGQLTSLQFLDLHSNNLKTLPEEIWNLKSLTVLNICSNILTSFPRPPFSVAKRISSTVNFRNFVSEPLTSNKLTPNDSRRPSVHSPLENDNGDVSAKIPLESTDELEEPESELAVDSSASSLFANTSSSIADSLLVLTLADNRLTDECFESISFLVALKSLNLSYNDLIEIPDGALRRVTRLTELYLSGNELTTLPSDELENLKALKLLFVNKNKLVSLPAELSQLPNLQHLDVGSNQLKYNISNWPYDWNWHWNKNLKYLNFSGNKRFEIKQGHIKNPETGEDFDSLLVLKKLKVLGLIDVTLTTPSVPDQDTEMRIRTTASELDNIGYGVSDSMGMREHVSTRDAFFQKFRGNENEVLICSFDGKFGAPNKGHRVSSLAKTLFVTNFTSELNKIKNDSEIPDALRKTFLSLNKDINGALSAKKSNTFAPSPQLAQDLLELNLTDDSSAGCSISVIYIKDKKMYTANTGDTEALLSRNNGDHILLTTKHVPTNRPEFERIRAAGGYVSGDGALDGELPISRGVGFFKYLPHTNSSPDITELSLTAADDLIVMATKVLWDYISYELAVDILRQVKDDPMLAAQKLRDYAICYGATDKITVIVVTLGEQNNNRLRFASNSLYNNLGRENDVVANKKRRDRAAVTGDSSLRRLEDEIEPPVGELALAFTDIKNSTLLWDAYPAPMRSAIKTHNSIMRRQLRIVGGYEVKTEGDAFMVSFPSPTAALLWCFNVQQNLLTADWPSEILDSDHCCEVTDNTGTVIFRGLSVRMGIHWGAPVCEPDVVTGRMDYFGPMVNRASRISAVADGGQTAVSSDFLDEIRTLNTIHKNIVEEKVSLLEAYQGNIQAGEIIEKEISSIEENGCHYFSLGERKLKGLETPEPITLAYTTKLKIRYDFVKSSKAEDSSTLVGTMPVDGVYGLRNLSLRLENLCCSIGCGGLVNETFQNSSKAVQASTSFKGIEMIGLLNHIVIRIESCVATLHLRQQMSIARGDDGYLDFANGQSIGSIMEELSAMVTSYKELQAAAK